MKVYQQAQQEYKNALKQKAKRQIIAIKPDATDEQGKRGFLSSSSSP
jgi:t-SNARE complex subunit (syntaxin)